jgi:putative ABC transport system ATP-binding protein
MADEPTGNLDSRSTRDVLALLRAAHRRGRTLLVATHDARVAAAADRMLTMSDGRIVEDRVLADARPVSLPFDRDPLP